MVEEEKEETGNTARAFVNGVWVDDNEKFACKFPNPFRRTLTGHRELSLTIENGGTQN